MFLDFKISAIFGLKLPAFKIPLKSPLISAAITGTPISLNFSAKVCRVTVFPVPVAPVITP
jgi:hypothetical protein